MKKEYCKGKYRLFIDYEGHVLFTNLHQSVMQYVPVHKALGRSHQKTEKTVGRVDRTPANMMTLGSIPIIQKLVITDSLLDVHQ